jgi:hypothetical protein
MDSLPTPAATSSCAYPLSCVKRGLWVVTGHGVDNGEPTPHLCEYSYGEGRTDLQLGEWLGFGWWSLRDTLSGKVATTTFDNRTRIGATYPYARLPVVTNVNTRNDDARRPAVTRLRTTIATYSIVNTAPGSLFLYASRTDERETELKSGAVPVLIRQSIRAETRDGFNNVTESETSSYPISNGVPVGIPSRTKITTTYDNFTASWLIGLVLERLVA